MDKKRLSSASAGRAARSFPPPRNFTDLDDTFSSYAGQADKFIVVNSGATKLTAIPLPAIAITSVYVVNLKNYYLLYFLFMNSDLIVT